MDLKLMKCKPCEGGILPYTSDEIENSIQFIDGEWKLVDSKLKREFRFVNFIHTMHFVNKVADLAESEGHHPDMHIGYGYCTIEIWTHAINGLSENDFILAAKIDALD